MTSEKAVPASEIVASYLANYLNRLAQSGGRAVFPSAEPNALADLCLCEIAERLPGDSTARRALLAERDALHAGLPNADAEDATYNLRALAWTRCRPVDDDELARVLEVGATEPALGSTAGLAWRLLLLASVPIPDNYKQERVELAERLSRWVQNQSQIETAASGSAQAFTRVAYAMGHAARRLGDAELAGTASMLVEALEHAHAQGGLLAAGESDVTSTMLAQLAVAAEAVEAEHTVDAALAELLARLDEERYLVRQALAPDKYQLSPWIPLAFVPSIMSTSQIEDVLDPQVAPLPAFTITSVRGSDQLYVGATDGSLDVERAISPEDLNLLLRRILETVAKKDTSPRQHGHMVIALNELKQLDLSLATQQAVEELIQRGLKVITNMQQGNGGWFYSHKGVPSVVYSAGSRSVTEFPDFQYTIDAAVPGVALCQAYLATGSPDYLSRARNALAFFEETVGRTERNGMPIWKLFPEDEKTPRMGTAVNYELWSGYFFSWLFATESDHEVRERLHRYIEEILNYTQAHLRTTGDIAYGDYVNELRTAYASWDAFLLWEIGTVAGFPEAQEMSRKIVRRLAQLVLPSGVVPNVADYFEEVGEDQRWLVHRHGVGPYPVRAYYQLYFAVAGSRDPEARTMAARAFGFTLLDLFEPTTGALNPGYRGRGEADIQAGVTARDWAVLTLAALPVLAGVDYRPDHTNVYAPTVRIDRMLTRLSDRVAAAMEAQPAEEAEEAMLWWLRGEVALGRGSMWPEAVRERFAHAVSAPSKHALLQNELRLDSGEDAILPLDVAGMDTDGPLAAQRLACLARLPDVGDREFETELHRFGAMQAEDMLFRREADGDVAAATAQVLVTLLAARRARPHLRAVDRIVRPAIKAVWDLLVDRQGQVTRAPGDPEPVGVDTQALFTLAFGEAAEALDWPRVSDFAAKLFLRLLLAYRTVHGVPGLRDERPDRSVREARAYFALASQRDRLGRWLETDALTWSAPARHNSVKL